jgi:fructose-bisphosphate aldolase class 1
MKHVYVVKVNMSFTRVLQEDARKSLDQEKEFYTALRQMLQDI